MLKIKRISIPHTLAALMLITFSMGCSDDPAPEVVEELVAEEFIPFLEDFVFEANARGVELDTDNLSIQLVDSISADHPGDECGFGWTNYDDEGNPRVEIINSKGCWTSLSYIEKENIIFHHLAHALVGSLHYGGWLEVGVYLSLTCAGCDQTQVYYDIDEMRAYYLDKIFDEDTPAPDWINNDNYLRTIFTGEDYDHQTLGWSAGRSNDLENVSGYRLFVEPPGVFETTSLGLAVDNQPLEGSTGSATIGFPIIDDFEGCTRLVIKAKAKSKGLVNLIWFTVQTLSNRPDDPFGEVLGTVWTYYRWLEEGELYDMETKLICLPPRAGGGFVRVEIQTDQPAILYFDDIQVELYD